MEKFLEIISSYWLFIFIVIILIIILFGVLYANSVFDRFMKVFENYNKHKVDFNGNAYDFANFLNETYFNNKLNIGIFDIKKLKSHASYNPNTKTVCLSEEIANLNSISSFAVVAHEFGHAIQHFKTPEILIKNSRLSRFVKFLGFLSYFIIAFSIFAFVYISFIVSALSFLVFLLNFTFAITLKISTLKIEKDASIKAIELLDKTGFCSDIELQNSQTVLEYAKKTYVGDLLSALLVWTGLIRKVKIF